MGDARCATAGFGAVAVCLPIGEARFSRFPVGPSLKPDGEILAGALPPTNTFNLADRAYFQRALSTRAFWAGD